MLLNKNVHEQVSTFNITLMKLHSQTTFPPIISLLMIKTPHGWQKLLKPKLFWKVLIKIKKIHWTTKFSNWDLGVISIGKDEYYNNLSKKFNDPNTSAKTYWSILKSFYKGNRVPLIPPLLVNNKRVSDFTEKANLFNDFFCLSVYTDQ